MAKVNITDSPLIQSGYTYLQAVGSDGTDGTVPGRHLKWDLLRSLGANHLPKGDLTSEDLYATHIGFNRENDYIGIYKAEFDDGLYYVDLNTSSTPTSKTLVNGKWVWQYSLPVFSGGINTSTVQLTFSNTAVYNDLAVGTNPTGNEAVFIAKYPTYIEVRMVDKLFFHCKFLATKKDSGTPFYIRAEAIGRPDRQEPSELQLNVRKSFTNPALAMSFFSENTDYVRFDSANAQGLHIRLYAYEDYIRGVNDAGRDEGNWEYINKFSLSLKDEDMEERFMSDYMDGTRGNWPKFNDTNSSGRFKVNKENYHERWRRSGADFPTDSPDLADPNGLQSFIDSYLQRSVGDLKAMVSFPSDDEEDSTYQTVSCLDMLRLVSLDYHVSRILGLGYIDVETEESNPRRYVYCMQYLTEAPLEESGTLSTAIDRSHVYMSLPTTMTDYRLPKNPQLDNCTYGATVDNGTDTPTELTDVNGYAPQENMRFINIIRKPYQHEKAMGPFFFESTEFSLAEETQPVAYGLEYKEISETSYRVPELSHDEKYRDNDDIPETMPILENGTMRMFTHQEEEEGTHVYAAYAINWFSRISGLSNTKQVTTDFPTIARLLPPFNFATQLIQDEDPSEEDINEKVLVLTTVAEQEKLEAIPESEDSTLVRTTFDWNHVHNHAHPTVDYAEFFFRENEPMVIKGKVATVTPFNADQAIITTTSYQVTSSFPAETVQPNVSALDSSRFIGSLLSCGQSSFVIDGVQTTGNNPTFLVRVLKQTQATAPVSGNQNQFLAVESTEMPEPGSMFFVIENMTQAANWDMRHKTQIYLDKFYTNSSIALRYSPTLAVNYQIDYVSLIGANTLIQLYEPLKSTATTGVTVEYTVKRPLHSISSGQVRIQGNWTTDLPSGKKVRFFANGANDGEYTLSAAATYNGTTNLTSFSVVESIPDAANFSGIVSFLVNRGLAAVNGTLNTITLSGDRSQEIRVASVDYITENDGSQTRLVTGGLSVGMWLEPLLDDQHNGTGFIQIVADWSLLDPHPDPRVSWYKGTVRLPDVSGKKQVYPVSYIGNLIDPSSTQLSFVIQDPGFVPADPSIPASADFYTLDLNDELPGNFHPSYRLYLRDSEGLDPVTGDPNSGAFKEGSILPATNLPTEGNKQTYMSVRSYDVVNDLSSFLSSPVVLMAQQIVPPVAPAQPKGPLFTTRPDVYGKSTYTFDTLVNLENDRQPYAMVFYRAAHDKLLDTLYSKDMQLLIYAALDLRPENFRYDPGLWDVLVNGIQDPSDPEQFMEYTTFLGSYRWPLPDNGDYYIQYQSPYPIDEYNPMGGYHKPFAEGQGFALNQPITAYGKATTGKKVLKAAILEAFIPLTEQPPVYAHLKTGRQTSNAASVIRDTNGKLLDPIANDIYPMVRTFTDGDEKPVRFTDYTLDGASTSLYFYCAAEMDSKLKMSDISPILGPVRMVDAFAPEQPQVRKTTIQLRDDYAELPAAVQFDMIPFIASERISKIAIYRCTDEIDALSVRTMELVNTVPFTGVIADDFSDVPFPLYGEQLYYRLVAIREIMEPTDVLNTGTVRVVEIPSKPSGIIKTTLADNVNPEAPDLTFIFGDNTSEAYEEVVVQWSATCYNGTYSLQKMNSSGNWNELYKVNQKTGVMTYPPLDELGEPDFDTFDKTVLLPKLDDDDNNIYHRFRVVVENASGLFNLKQKEFICQEVLLTGEDFDTLGLEDNTGTIIY